jgi:hypothetical protein
MKHGSFGKCLQTDTCGNGQTLTRGLYSENIRKPPKTTEQRMAIVDLYLAVATPRSMPLEEGGQSRFTLGGGYSLDSPTGRS